MNQTHLIYLFYIVKHFTPFSSFLVPFLIEVKKFKNIEIYNNLNVYFFFSSLITSLSVFVLVRFIGDFNLLIFDILMELCAYFLLIMMGEKNFVIAKIISILHGSSTALGSVLRSIIISSTSNNKYQNAYVKNIVEIIRSIINVLSSWIGQDLFIRTSQHNINLYLTGGSILCALIVSFFFDKTVNLANKEPSVPLNLDLFTNGRFVFFGMLHITANTLMICIAFFSSNIFIERKKCGRNTVARYIFKLLKPFRLISSGVIKIYTFFGGSIDNPKDLSVLGNEQVSRTKGLVVHGYIDGISKICASLMCYFIAQVNIRDEYRIYTTLGLIFATIINLYFLYKLESLEFSYLFFILAFSMSIATKTVIFVEFTDHPNKNFIFSLLMFLSSVIHITLSFIAIRLEADVRQRFKYYLYTSMILIIMAIGALLLVV